MEPAPKKSTKSGGVLLGVALVLTALPRGVALWDQGIFPEATDLWGFVADGVVGLWVGLLLMGLHRWKPWAAASVAAPWAVLGFLAAEHVRVLGVWPDARHSGMLGETTFVLGSVLRPAHPGWMWATATLAFVVVWRMDRLRACRTIQRGLLTAGAATFLLIVAPAPDAARGWRSTHYVSENLGRLWSDRIAGDGLAAAQDIAIGESHRQRVDAWFRTDLDGERLTAPPDEKLPNVLMIVVESLGSDRIGPIHGQAHDPREAPHLSALAERSLFVPRFVNQQRQTNRGTYALLSGALPLLQKSTPRMSVFASLPERPYLPAVLSGHGYRTAYLQSADLAFMGKAPFLEAAGFGEVLSAAEVRPARASSAWGVDDVTLMDETLRWIDAAEREALQPDANNEAEDLPAGRPWFLTVVTAGTHHPYMIPNSFAWLPGETEDHRAFRYADSAIGHLVAGLDAREAWRDTLVIITSDETGVTADRGRIPHPISEAWGVFMAAVPGGETGPIDGLYAQGDVALSVLDALGLAEASPPFPGRSVFRYYDTPRELPFANVYRRQIGVFGADGSVEIYGEHFNPIARFIPAITSESDYRHFSDLRQDEDAADHDFAARPLLAALALRQSAGQSDRGGESRTFVPAGRYTVVPSADPERGGLLIHGQYFYGPAHSQVRVEVALTPDADADVSRIELAFLDLTVPLERDQDGRYFADHAVSLERAWSSFDVALRVYTEDVSPVDVEVERARITITPLVP